jgi:hypothetical protein
MKLKRGTIREDGMVFSHYHRGGKERWITQAMLESQKNRDKKFHKKWRSENQDVVSGRNKAWREANPDKARDNLREWRNKNREKNLESTREWRKANPEKVKLMYENRKKNIEKFRLDGRVKRAKRRAMLLERLHPDHNVEIEKTLSAQCKSLFTRFGIKFEVDHIVPLTKGGWHHHSNLHVIPLSWNRRKHNKENEILPNCWNLDYRCKISVD